MCGKALPQSLRRAKPPKPVRASGALPLRVSVYALLIRVSVYYLLRALGVVRLSIKSKIIFRFTGFNYLLIFNY